MNNRTSRRFWEIAIGLLLILVGVSAFGANELLFGILLVLGVYLVVKQFATRSAR
jgi:hypothetical protein